MSPVEICGKCWRSCSKRACVPLPAPGAPIKTMILDIGIWFRTWILDVRFDRESLRRGLQTFPKNQIANWRSKIQERLCSAPAQSSTTAQKSFIVPHDELGFDL